MTRQVYNGDKPYIFVSYSHRDSARVIPAIESMMERGYRIWYDQGIEAGSEWADNIARHLNNCFAFVAFTSANSVKSENCLDEIAFAKSKGKPSLMIFLENAVVLPEGTEMQTARFQRIYYLPGSPVERFIRDIGGASFLDPCREGYVPSARVSQGGRSSAGKNKLPSAGGKRTAAIVITVLLTLTVAAAAILPRLTRGGGRTEDDTLDFFRPQYTYDPTTTFPTVSDSLADLTYSLNGHVYSLPTAISELVGNGWALNTMGNYKEIMLKAHHILNTSIRFGSSTAISVTVYNPTGNSIPVSECYITKITVPYKAGIPFTISGGITFDNGFNEIVDAFGEPTSLSNDSKGYTNIKYVFDKSTPESAYTHILIDNEPETRPGQVPDSEITLYTPHHYFLLETEADPTVPDCVKDYVAPTGLSTDIFSGIFTDGDAFYRLLCPFKELLDNGWVIRTEGVIPLPVDSVASGDTATVWLQKGDYTASVSVINNAEYQTLLQNCMVYYIDVSHSTTVEPNTIFAISPDLRFGDKGITHFAEAFIDEAAEKTVSTSGDYSTYRLIKKTEAGTVTISININVKDGYCQCLSIRLET